MKYYYVINVLHIILIPLDYKTKCKMCHDDIYSLRIKKSGM